MGPTGPAGIGLPGPPGATGATGPTGPQGAPGTGIAFAGAVNGTTGAIRTGTGLSARRLANTASGGSTVGTYRITAPALASGAALAVTVTATNPVGGTAAVTALTGRVIQAVKQGDGTYLIDVEFRNISNSLTDTDFYFIAVQMS